MQSKTQPIEKPIILAICGKSCAGKDTLARELIKYFNSIGLPAYRMISSTTRPPRVGETFNDYIFMSEEFFQKTRENKLFLETTSFRRWCYGLSKSEVKSGKINIGVFDLKGINSLARYKYEYTVIPIYIDQPLSLRLRRSYCREGRWKLEYFRRALADSIHFKNAIRDINLFNGRKIILNKPANIKECCPIILNKLKYYKIIVQSDDKKLRLGNFI